MAKYTRKIPLPGKSADEIYAKISAGIDHFIHQDTGTFGKFELQRDPGAKTVSVKSPLVTADLVCREGEIELNASLSFIASAFKSKIDQGIDRWVAKTFLA